MGLSSNQARFLSLTSRQIDLEKRVQEICQRRLRLSNQSERIAQHYNEQTSDRRLFLNTSDSFSSSIQNGTGTVTHDNLSDNNQYTLLTASNLYDNGLHLFANGTLVNSDGSMVTKTKTGTKTFTLAEIGTGKSVGDWVAPAPPLSYQITTLTPKAYNIVAPTAGDAGAISGSSSSAIQTGTPNATTPTAWTGGTIVQNPSTGFTTQTFTRTNSVETAVPNVSITQTSMTDLMAGTKNPTPVNINGVDFNEYTYTDYAGRPQTRLAIGDVGSTPAAQEANAKIQLNALASSGSTVTNNFILMTDVDMTSVPNWGIIDNFSGIFDGNLHTISNLNIAPATDTNVGMFGAISNTGVVKNLTLANEKIAVTTDPLSGGWNSAANYNNIGGIAGVSNGSISNCNTTNIDMNITGPGVKVGGIVGESFLSLSNCSSSGSIDMTGEGHQVGGLAGLSSGGNILYSSSSVNIKTNTTSNPAGIIGASSHLGTLIGDVDNGSATNTNSIKYCYASGTINGSANSFAGAADFSPSIAPPSSLSNDIISYSYYGTPGSGTTAPTTNGVYDSVPGRAPDAGATWTDIKDATTVINGTSMNVWNPNGTLNQSAINTESGNFKKTTTWTETLIKTDDPGMTIIADEYTDTLIPATPLTSEQLEAGLRDGSIKLAKHADTTTQNPVTVAGVDEKYEYVDWRTQSVISDDLYTANDEEAQSQYEHAVSDVNHQDKQLELEQTKITTEYTAVTSEKEAVKKILDTNVKGSFKYFG